MQSFGAHCYKFYHSGQGRSWRGAQESCNASKGSLTSVVSKEEWRFLTQSLVSSPDFDKKSTYWLGGSIDHTNQLVWADRMPFNFSAFHPSDLQSISEWKCLSLYWHGGGKGTFAWRLSDCNQVSGYVCKKNTQVDIRPELNRTFSGTGGTLTSPNFPGLYYTSLDYTNQLTAPPGTQIVIQFLHLDLEDQEDCLYDYVEIMDRRTRNFSRVCGSHPPNELNKFDFVSSSNGVDLTFHSDWSKNYTGYEVRWRAVDVTECLSGRTIMTGLGGPAPPATLYTPNFPYFNLPGLHCVYTIVAPAGQRIWLHFDIFEIGGAEEDCEAETDHVLISLSGDSDPSHVPLCGNLTSAPLQTSFVSYSEKLVIRIVSPEGRTGRGFLAKFKAVPAGLSETVSMSTSPNSSYTLQSLNYPLAPPPSVNLSLQFLSPPNYVLSVRVQGNAFHNCHLSAGSYVVIHDPYVGTNGTSWTICEPDIFQVTVDDGQSLVRPGHFSTAAPVLRTLLSPIQSSAPITFRSTFNRLELTQVYTARSQGTKWNAEISTTIDEDFRAKVLAGGDRLLLHNACSPNPCTNNGKCVTEGDKYICRCQLPYTGPFCGLSICDLNPCRFGECFVEDKTYRCVCQMGYGGEKCDRTSRPCDDRPCTGHGECVEVTNSTYKCLCHAFWEGPRCEARMLQIPFRPLSERMLREPFWLGIITVTSVLGVIGICWCFKRHFPEKLEKLLNEDPDRNRGISWVSGRSPSSIRIGGGSSIRDSLPGTSSQQATSPQTARTFLGRFGIRKPSLLSLSSATSVSVAATSPHTYENRTFSLDDLLRPSRGSMMRTPSPHRRRNFSIHGRRDPVEKQQILQQLMSIDGGDGGSTPSKPSTPKPTIAEIIQMSEKRLRLASFNASQQSQSSPPAAAEDRVPGIEIETDQEHETCFSTLTPTSKAEKKVTFARLLEKLTATEMSSSSCDSDSCVEEGSKTVVVHPKPPKKERKGRFRRSRPYTRGRTSETDQEGVEMSSSDTTPDPIYTPRFPSRACGSPTGLVVGSPNAKPGTSKSMNKIASADSLLALFRRFSGSNSAPPSPQYSENEESSAGATPLSTPSSPRNSALSLNIRPPAFLITTAEPNTFELPVIDPFANPQPQTWRAGQLQNTNSITLEVPMRDYCLSPIHEVPTPLPTPSHSPAHSPMMMRPKVTDSVPAIQVSASSEAEDEGERRPGRPLLRLPMISISVDEEEGLTADLDVFEDENGRRMTGETEVIPDVLIHVPPEATNQSNPNLDLVEETRFSFDINLLPKSEHETNMTPNSAGGSPRLKTKPPPLVFANQILSYVRNSNEGLEKARPSMEIPSLSIEYATPVAEILPNFPPEFQGNMPDITSFTAVVSPKPWDHHPLLPMIMINQSSEAESDSDTPTLRKVLRKPNMMFLSPFAGTSDRVPSESNLSTSGYSSMASPCPSRCPSVSPLCPDSDDFHCTGGHGGRRSSLTPASSRKSSLTNCRRFSLNGSSLLGSFCEPSENNLVEMERETETDSAVEVETETDIEPKLFDELGGSITNLLQVPRSKSLPKSRSLDMNVVALGSKLEQLVREQRRGVQLRGDSLDSKLNTLQGQPAGLGTKPAFLATLSLSASRLLKGQTEPKRLSPLSSRSESPLSELNLGCRDRVPGGLTSPMSDSDGLYECGSSEQVGSRKGGAYGSLHLLSPSQQIRRSGRRRDRRICSVKAPKREDFLGLDLPPGLALGGSKRTSPKRRTRAQPNLDARSTSSSESGNSQRSRGSTSSPVTQESATLTSDKTSLVERSSPSEKPEPRLKRSPNVSCEEFTKPVNSASKEQEQNDKVPEPISTRSVSKVTVSPVPSSKRKTSRLRTIGLQIRFLRRLEQSLIRKREKMGVSRAEKRESLLSRTESSDSSSSSSTCSHSSCCTSSSSCSGCNSGTSGDSKFPSTSCLRDRDLDEDEDGDGTEEPLLSKPAADKGAKLLQSQSQPSLTVWAKRRKGGRKYK